MSATPPFVGNIFEPKPTRKEPSIPVPYACIRKGPLETYCYRTPSTQEFMFTDARHAIAHYVNGTHLRVCKDCHTFAASAIAKEEASMGVKLP